MDINLSKSNIAIVGGGLVCKAILQIFFIEDFKDQRPVILGVADLDDQAPGLRYAQEKGIFTTSDYREFYKLEDLDMIIELTKDNTLREIIKKTKPAQVKLIDHFSAMSVWDYLKIEEERLKARRDIQVSGTEIKKIEEIFDRFSNRITKIVEERTDHLINAEEELVESERAMTQIIQGSNLPTFVINKDHIVTHWNKAMEKLTGYSADKIVGTNKQWLPFWDIERPTMADVILDQIKEDEIKKLYGTKSSKSALIEGAYEAEVFFPKLGQNGRWCFFTAAPIKAPDGKMIGAIETLWDKTEDKQAEEVRERHTRELSTLCSIYSALNAPSAVEERINASIQEIIDFLSAECVCIYLMESDGKFHLKYSYGFSEEACKKDMVAAPHGIIQRIAQSGMFTIFDRLPQDCSDEICSLEQENFVSWAYIPISTKERNPFGVIKIASKKPDHFSYENKEILELIGNRIGIAIENAMLQEQYIKSEEKYRSLFNYDPNPIFIMDCETFEILDTNQRAQDCYGYTREELYGFQFLKLGAQDDQAVAAGLKNLSPGQSVLFSKKRHYKKGRRPFYVNINVSYARYGESDVLIANTTDITESVDQETQLIQAGKMATLGVMASGMAHEINQPLNVIQICADFFLKMLKKGQSIKDDDLKTMANDIVTNVERAAGVIKHVRDFARQSEIVPSRLNINDPIKDVFKVLGNQLKVHQIELELDLDPKLPDIMAEHNRLEQVFINLVTNAMDAIDEKSAQSDINDSEKRITIQSFTENGQVVVNVSDTGIGMSEDVKSKILEPFFTTKKIGKGTGLGVSISYGIIKDYDGSIEIESEVGQGTKFKISFPFLQ